MKNAATIHIYIYFLTNQFLQQMEKLTFDFYNILFRLFGIKFGIKNKFQCQI